MNKAVTAILLIAVIAGACWAIYHFVVMPEPTDRAEHHVHEQDMGPGEIFAYNVPQKDQHRIRISIEASGGVDFAVVPTDYSGELQGNGWFLDHVQGSDCAHINVSNATFDCATNPPLLLVFADGRPADSASRDRIHVKVDAYDCTTGCPDLPQ